METLRPRNQGVTTSPGKPIGLHGSLSNSFLWERPTWRGSNSPPWKRSRMAHRSDSEASRLGLNLLLSNHCHWHRLVCYEPVPVSGARCPARGQALPVARGCYPPAPTAHTAVVTARLLVSGLPWGAAGAAPVVQTRDRRPLEFSAENRENWTG